MSIKAILFDFGGVLDAPDDLDAWLSDRDHLAAPFGMTGQQLWEHIFVSEAWRQSERGKITEEAFWIDRLAPLGLRSEAERQEFVRRLFARRIIDPAMRALLDRLRGRCALAVLSNTAVRNLETWLEQRWGLAGVFDDVIGSADVGLAKPEEAIYRLALERLGVQPQEVVFIDDTPRNLPPAQALGIQTLRFESPQALEAALRERGVLDSAPLTVTNAVG